MQSLSTILLTGNSLEYPPQEVCDKGITEIKNYIETERKVRLSATKVR